VVPPLQLGAVGPYSLQGTLFPSHLQVEGTWSYPDLLSHNQWPAVQDPITFSHRKDEPVREERLGGALQVGPTTGVDRVQG
jgi:hypothetical protein